MSGEPRVANGVASAPRAHQRLAKRRLRFPAAAVWWFCLVGLTLWCFGSVLFAANNFVYRDAAHFYPPLFRAVADEWAAGRVPLWNPHENLGSPLLAQGTASVFYPGKLLFALPALGLPVSFDLAFKLYTISHVMLAAWGAYRLARLWIRSVTASALCGLSYAFCGNVLFQYSNVVFLVGAAWLPIAVSQLDRLLVERRLARAIPLAVTLALMVLGGDPQMAYHVILIGGLYAWLLRRTHREALEPVREPGWHALSRDAKGVAVARVRAWSKNAVALLLLAGGLAGLLSAVQVLPSWELNALSERAAADEPRNVYEAAASLARGNFSAGGLLAQPSDSQSHAALAYDFSVGPWRLAEFVWPNVAGREFPVNRRWMSILPADGGGRLWTPSLYMGLLPLLLAFSAWTLRSGDVRGRWMSWVVLLALLASFGRFGLGRLWREIGVHWDPSLADAANAPVGDPCGGLYWLMNVLLPGYAQFRYPAKLLVLASLGLSLLAARGWDHLTIAGAALRILRWLRRGAVISAIGVVTLVCGAWKWDAWLASAPPSPLFGPLDVNGAWWDACIGLLHAICVAVAIGWLMFLRARHAGARWLGVAAVLLTAVDLGMANGWLIATAPAERWQRPSVAAEAIQEAPSESSEPCRVDRPIQDWWPSAWASVSSPDRQTAGLTWDRDTLYPRYGLSSGIDLLKANDTSALLDVQLFIDQIQRTADGDDRLHPGGLDLLGVKFLLLPRGTQPPDHGASPWSGHSVTGNDRSPASARSEPDGFGSRSGPNTFSWRLRQSLHSTATEYDESSEEFRLWENIGAFPRAWVAPGNSVQVMPPVKSHRPDDIAARTEEVLFADGQPRDFRSTAVVEASEAQWNRAQMASFDLPVQHDATRSWIDDLPWRLGLRRSFHVKAFDGADSACMSDTSIYESCKPVVLLPHRIELSADVRPGGGLLVLSEIHYPGWRAEVTTEGQELAWQAPILRTNRILRGVWLPAGRHQVVFTYRPSSFYWGLGVSIAAWLAIVFSITVRRWRGRRARMSASVA